MKYHDICSNLYSENTYFRYGFCLRVGRFGLTIGRFGLAVGRLGLIVSRFRLRICLFWVETNRFRLRGEVCLLLWGIVNWSRGGGRWVVVVAGVMLAQLLCPCEVGHEEAAQGSKLSRTHLQLLLTIVIIN